MNTFFRIVRRVEILCRPFLRFIRKKCRSIIVVARPTLGTSVTAVAAGLRSQMALMPSLLFKWEIRFAVLICGVCGVLRTSRTRLFARPKPRRLRKGGGRRRCHAAVPLLMKSSDRTKLVGIYECKWCRRRRCQDLFSKTFYIYI